ncbi:hypothetical protein CDAR_417771 [Caerostris darwini]|uniref:Uncharacterized protein n=1 Tax=Caerostris darwini TaxID=1538125 RepID=A0AAV4PUS3_9ARAC|nr:hypothetical protein CDAR_417771 [Caerostris darwini]
MYHILTLRTAAKCFDAKLSPVRQPLRTQKKTPKGFWEERNIFALLAAEGVKARERGLFVKPTKVSLNLYVFMNERVLINICVSFQEKDVGI